MDKNGKSEWACKKTKIKHIYVENISWYIYILTFFSIMSLKFYGLFLSYITADA